MLPLNPHCADVHKRLYGQAISATLLLTLTNTTALAHDPVFGLGPHTLFAQGVELHIGADRNETAITKETVTTLELAYGLTADWTIRTALPYVRNNNRENGIADINIASKYRFWRRDSLGVQESSTLFFKLKPESAGDNRGSGTTDAIAGLSYGYESRKWYRWASVRYRNNGKTYSGLARGDRLLIDLAGGIRFRPTGYLEPDWVWMLELNGELSEQDRLDGSRLGDSGGEEWFLSPGLMWTLRNFAIKTGLQFPVVKNLNNRQNDSEYRARLELEWHR